MNLADLHKRINERLKRIKELPKEVDSTVYVKWEMILQLNKDQLLLGRDNQGQMLTPGYTEDPYFKTSESAQVYARMKERLEVQHRARVEHNLPYPDKGKNTPNLIVKGNFQDAMSITMGGSSYMIQSSYVDAGDISDKYGNKVYGLSPESRRYFYENVLYAKLYNHIYQ